MEARAASLGRNLGPLVISPEKNNTKFSSQIINNQQILRKNSKMMNFADNLNLNNNADETVFESFIGDDNFFYQTNNVLRKKTSFLSNNLNPSSPLVLSPPENKEKVELIDSIQEFKSYSPLKYVINIKFFPNFIKLALIRRNSSRTIWSGSK